MALAGSAGRGFGYGWLGGYGFGGFHRGFGGYGRGYYGGFYDPFLFDDWNDIESYTVYHVRARHEDRTSGQPRACVRRPRSGAVDE